jgi:hypothetical protein
MKLVLVFLALGTLSFALPLDCTGRRPETAGKMDLETGCPAVAPLPSSLLLGAVGMAGCGLLARRRNPAA